MIGFGVLLDGVDPGLCAGHSQWLSFVKEESLSLSRVLGALGHGRRVLLQDFGPDFWW